MRTVPRMNYEAMILLGQSAAVDLAGTVGFIKDTIARYQGEIISLKKWADRPLCFPIQKQKRGLYILCYFSAPTSQLGDIDRAFNLSDQVLRQLIIKADHLSIEEMQAADAQLDLTIEANLRAGVVAPAAPVAAAQPAPAQPAGAQAALAQPALAQPADAQAVAAQPVAAQPADAPAVAAPAGV